MPSRLRAEVERLRARLAEVEAERDAWKVGAHKDASYLERALEKAEQERNDLVARLAEVEAENKRLLTLLLDVPPTTAQHNRQMEQKAADWNRRVRVFLRGADTG